MEELFPTENHFNPNLIIADKATSIKNAVARKLGAEQMQNRYSTCQLHFKSSILQHCSFVIGDKRAIFQYMQLSVNLMKAVDPTTYNLLKKEMNDFISKTERRHEYLMNWFEFYDSRRTGWSNAFRNPDLPQTNKGEAGNAHYSAVTGLTGLTLDMGVKCMIAEYHVYAGCRRGIVNGQYKGGKGPSRVAMDEKMIKETFSRIENTQLTPKDALKYVEDILKAIGVKEHENLDDQSQSTPVQKQRSEHQLHKHLAEQIKARKDAHLSSPKYINAPHKAPKKNLVKRKVKFTDNFEDLSLSSKQQKTNKKSLDEKALLSLKEGVSLEVVVSGLYSIIINQDKNINYRVDLQTNEPSCTFPMFQEIIKTSWG